MASSIKEELGHLKGTLESLSDNLSKYTDSNNRLLESLTTRVTNLEVNQARHNERLTIQTVFQTTLSTVVGAIATYLGVTK
jgi:Mg2+ and Co2+ transporter CorA